MFVEAPRLDCWPQHCGKPTIVMRHGLGSSLNFVRVEVAPLSFIHFLITLTGFFRCGGGDVCGESRAPVELIIRRCF